MALMLAKQQAKAYESLKETARLSQKPGERASPT